MSKGKILFFNLRPLDFIIQGLLFHNIFFFEFEYQVFESFKNFKFLLAKFYGFTSLFQKCFLDLLK